VRYGHKKRKKRTSFYFTFLLPNKLSRPTYLISFSLRTHILSIILLSPNPHFARRLKVGVLLRNCLLVSLQGKRREILLSFQLLLTDHEAEARSRR